MRYQVEGKDIQTIVRNLNAILQKTYLYHENTPHGLSCYYRIWEKGRKLLFYLNVRKKEVIFGISHRGTDILEKFPLLPSLADETKTSVMKFSIKKLEDIKKKWIHKLIDIILSSQLDFINEKYMVTNQKTQKCLSQTKSTKKGKGCSYWAYGRWRKKSSG